jgi:hypothetical protein
MFSFASTTDNFQSLENFDLYHFDCSVADVDFYFSSI